MIYTILILIILVIIFFSLWRSNSKKIKGYQIQIKRYQKMQNVEADKTVIREEYNDKKTEILTNDNIVTDGVMPINAIKKSGKFNRSRENKTNPDNS